eukprot:CAMPEP_0183748498 /NCGR_PEP_ID=MMETSP0737-20130205/67803_1 /TAXON_ID=385413 /ORGANISM="Thalassiosira miniscula, Strain CCMP1093" /LENGTH=322 /DNA_ID=CAMNT_0025984229 /DNA_START=508 /DNA_END=1473 /DNA_ORIENTATION=-
MTNVHVGIPPRKWEHWERHLVHFHHFESLPVRKLVQVKSPVFRCYNHEWRLTIYPGGDIGSPDGMIAVYLEHCSRPKISARYAFKIRRQNGRVFDEVTSFRYDRFTEGKKWGWTDLTEYATIVNPANRVLNRGTLTVEVCIQPDDKNICTNFFPNNQAARNILRSFMDERTADVIFELQPPAKTGSGLDDSARDGYSTSLDDSTRDEYATSVRVPAHKLIVQLCARGSKLASLCENSDKSTPVVIRYINPDVFRLMLWYVYGGNIAAAEWIDRSEDFIDAANRFGLESFKIEAEAWYIKDLELSVHNVIETLEFAEEKNCSL